MRIKHAQSCRKDVPTGRRLGRRPAFTLVELLVVVAIIALLIAILVPSFAGVRNTAKAAATQSQIAGLTTGLDAYKQESGLGGMYPPSRTDELAETPPWQTMSDPFSLSESDRIANTAGASLLVYALNGADGLGTAGFLDRGGEEGWWDDMSADPNADPVGAYAMGKIGDPQEGDALVPRYGPFADSDPLINCIRTIADLIDTGVYDEAPDEWEDEDLQHKVFTDQWNHPILYYKARRGARALVEEDCTGKTLPGIYEPRDNTPFTGLKDTWAGAAPRDGLWCPGGGKTREHPLWNVVSPGICPGDPIVDLEGASFKDSFQRYIWDSTVTARPTPVNKDTFLLISAGKDGRYGTNDDVTNFGKR